MSYIILLFGILILLLGVVILVKPDSILGLIRSHSESLRLHVLAVVVRLALGVALITYSAESHYPVALQVLGWLTVTVAIILAIVGRARFKRLMTWALSWVFCHFVRRPSSLCRGLRRILNQDIAMTNNDVLRRIRYIFDFTG